MGLAPYAERFARAGIAALAFTYRHFGDSGGEPRQLLDIDRQLEDWGSALRFVRGLENVPDAEPGYRALVPEGLRFEDKVAARILLRVPFYRPGRAAAKLGCPVLFCVCERDSGTSGPTLRYAEQAPRGEIKRYPVGHFDIYSGTAFELVVADQVDFLTRHLF
jgi:hypothetical protein